MKLFMTFIVVLMAPQVNAVSLTQKIHQLRTQKFSATRAKTFRIADTSQTANDLVNKLTMEERHQLIATEPLRQKFCNGFLLDLSKMRIVSEIQSKKNCLKSASKSESSNIADMFVRGCSDIFLMDQIHGILQDGPRVDDAVIQKLLENTFDASYDRVFPACSGFGKEKIEPPPAASPEEGSAYRET